MKMCVTCKQEKQAAEFHRHRRNKDGLQSDCKTCSRARKIDWILRNPDKVRRQDRVRYERHAEKIKARIARWGRANPEKRKTYCDKWDAENIDKKRAYVRTRQAMRRKAVPAWASVEEIKKVYAEARDAELRTGVQHDVDHIVPLQSPLVCGLHWEGNLRVMRAFDNGRKSNRAWPDMPT